MPRRTAPLLRGTVPLPRETAPLARGTAPFGKRTVLVAPETVPFAKRTVPFGVCLDFQGLYDTELTIKATARVDGHSARQPPWQPRRMAFQAVLAGGLPACLLPPAAARHASPPPPKKAKLSPWPVPMNCYPTSHVPANRIRIRWLRRVSGPAEFPPPPRSPSYPPHRPRLLRPLGRDLDQRPRPPLRRCHHRLVELSRSAARGGGWSCWLGRVFYHG